MSHGFGSTKHPDSCIARNFSMTEVCCAEVMPASLPCSTSSASLLEWNVGCLRLVPVPGCNSGILSASRTDSSRGEPDASRRLPACQPCGQDAPLDLTGKMAVLRFHAPFQICSNG